VAGERFFVKTPEEKSEVVLSSTLSATDSAGPRLGTMTETSMAS